MARIWKLSIEVHPPNDQRDHYCVEAFETVRTARPNRVLHFSIGNPPTDTDVDWLKEVIGIEIETLIGRTIGSQGHLSL